MSKARDCDPPGKLLQLAGWQPRRHHKDVRHDAKGIEDAIAMIRMSYELRALLATSSDRRC